MCTVFDEFHGFYSCNAYTDKPFQNYIVNDNLDHNDVTLTNKLCLPWKPYTNKLAKYVKE